MMQSKGTVATQVMNMVRDMHPGLWNFICYRAKKEFLNESYSHIRNGKASLYELYIYEKDGVFSARMVELSNKCEPRLIFNLDHFVRLAVGKSTGVTEVIEGKIEEVEPGPVWVTLPAHLL